MFLHLLFDDWIFSRLYARHGDPAIDAKLDRTARDVVDAARNAETDEVVVIGHSLGAVLAIDLLDRALRIEPTLGQKGARVALISVGSSILKIGLHPAAARFRASADRVASAPGLFWGDYQAISDLMNFYKRDPLTAMGLPARDAPLVRMVRIRHMLDPAVYKRIRYRPLRMHLQFVSGNNLRNAYDYFMLVCGPLSVERQTRGHGALEAIGADGALLDKKVSP
jgi:pimeloyl-ACP methyl ester carboxylesterase